MCEYSEFFFFTLFDQSPIALNTRSLQYHYGYKEQRPLKKIKKGIRQGRSLAFLVSILALGHVMGSVHEGGKSNISKAF